jgi:hypothetical protein
VSNANESYRDGRGEHPRTVGVRCIKRLKLSGTDEHGMSVEALSILANHDEQAGARSRGPGIRSIYTIFSEGQC